MTPKNPKNRKRLWLLIALAVTVTASVVAYIEYDLARPIGSGPAGPTVDATRFTLSSILAIDVRRE